MAGRRVLSLQVHAAADVCAAYALEAAVHKCTAVCLEATCAVISAAATHTAVLLSTAVPAVQTIAAALAVVDALADGDALVARVALIALVRPTRHTPPDRRACFLARRGRVWVTPCMVCPAERSRCEWWASSARAMGVAGATAV